MRSRVVEAITISYGAALRRASRLAVLSTCTGPTRSSSSIGGTTSTTIRRGERTSETCSGAREAFNGLAQIVAPSSGFAGRRPVTYPRVNPYRGLRGLPADVWIVAATTFVNRAGTMVLPFLVLYLTQHLRVAPAVAGLAVSAYGAGGMLTAPIAGRLADRFGAFPMMRASLAASGLLLLALPLVRDFRLILVLVFAWAVVADALRPASMSALTAAAPPGRRKAAIALNRLGVNLGMSIGPALGGLLAVVSFPLLFVVDGLSSLAAAALLTALLRLRRPATEGAALPAERADASTASTGRSVVWHDRTALLFFTGAILMNVVFTQHQGAMPVYLVQHLGYRESFYGAMFMINTAIIVAIEVPLNTATEHWRPRPATAFATVLIAVGFGALALARSHLAIALTVIVWTFGEMIFFPTAMAYVAELAPPGRMGEYMGAFSSTFSLALLVGPWFGVAMLDRFGAPVTWGTMFVLGLAAAALGSVRARPVTA
jgi:MFS family permease